MPRYVVHRMSAEHASFFPMLEEGDVVEVPDSGFPEMDGSAPPGSRSSVIVVRALHPNTAAMLGYLAETGSVDLRPAEVVR